eukprot:TRINITY_DN767_c0_g5_i1.p1 TRINITY_DN767_c0_g5~~TRINITY_DN767_c0_g5_i1.p1  ORF type:complete len:2049 (+),score=476.82 TRINITY_DN767_c0_g5_i1:216-6362(+)
MTTGSGSEGGRSPRPVSAQDVDSGRKRKSKAQRYTTVHADGSARLTVHPPSDSSDAATRKRATSAIGGRSTTSSGVHLVPQKPKGQRVPSSRGRRGRSAKPRSRRQSASSQRSDASAVSRAADPNAEVDKLNDMMEGLASALELTTGTLGDDSHDHDEPLNPWRTRVPLSIINYHLFGRDVGTAAKTALEQWLQIVSRKSGFQFELDLSQPQVKVEKEDGNAILISEAGLTPRANPLPESTNPPEDSGQFIVPIPQVSITDVEHTQAQLNRDSSNTQDSTGLADFTVPTGLQTIPESDHEDHEEEGDKAEDGAQAHAAEADDKEVPPRDTKTSHSMRSELSNAESITENTEKTAVVLKAQLDEGKDAIREVQFALESLAADLEKPLPISKAPSMISLNPSPITGNSLAVGRHASDPSFGDADGIKMDGALQGTVAHLTVDDIPSQAGTSGQHSPALSNIGDTLTEETVALLQQEREKARNLQVVVKGALERVMEKLHGMEQQAISLEKNAQESKKRGDKKLAYAKATELNSKLEDIVKRMLSHDPIGGDDDDDDELDYGGLLKSKTENSLDSLGSRENVTDLDVVSKVLKTDSDLLALSLDSATIERAKKKAAEKENVSEEGQALSSPREMRGSDNNKDGSPTATTTSPQANAPSSDGKKKKPRPPPLLRANTESAATFEAAVDKKAGVRKVESMNKIKLRQLSRMHTRDLKKLAKHHRDTMTEVISSIQDAYGNEDSSVRLIKKLGEATAELETARVELATVRKQALVPTTPRRSDVKTPTSGGLRSGSVGRSYNELHAEHVQSQGAMYAPKGKIALVFTDVENSTDLWEWDDTVMSKSLDIHDQIMRSEIDRLHGYEVKTEGDAFMVSFESPIVAVNWCLSVQKRLLEAEWPEKLFEYDNCKILEDPQGRLQYRGLRVRMGVHMGSPIWRRDPLTKRMDYFGPVVNRAARVASSAHGGQVVVSGGVYQAMTNKRDTLACTTLPLGQFYFKGLKSPEMIVQVNPTTIGSRSFPPLRGARPNKMKKKKSTTGGTPKTPKAGSKGRAGAETPNSDGTPRDRSKSRASESGSGPLHRRKSPSLPGIQENESASSMGSGSKLKVEADHDSTSSLDSASRDIPKKSPSKNNLLDEAPSTGKKSKKDSGPKSRRPIPIAHASSQTDLAGDKDDDDAGPPQVDVDSEAVEKSTNPITGHEYVSINGIRKLLAEARKLKIRKAVSEDLKREYFDRLRALEEQLSKLSEDMGTDSPSATADDSYHEREQEDRAGTDGGASPTVQAGQDAPVEGAPDGTSTTLERRTGAAASLRVEIQASTPTGKPGPRTMSPKRTPRRDLYHELDNERQEIKHVISYLEDSAWQDSSQAQLLDEQGVQRTLNWDLESIAEEDEGGSEEEEEEESDDDDDDDDDDEEMDPALAKLVRNSVRPPAASNDILDALTFGSPLKDYSGQDSYDAQELQNLRSGIEMQKEELTLAEMHISALNEQNMILEEELKKAKDNVKELDGKQTQEETLEQLQASKEETVFWREKLTQQLKEAQDEIRDLRAARSAALQEARTRRSSHRSSSPQSSAMNQSASTKSIVMGKRRALEVSVHTMSTDGLVVPVSRSASASDMSDALLSPADSPGKMLSPRVKNLSMKSSQSMVHLRTRTKQVSDEIIGRRNAEMDLISPGDIDAATESVYSAPSGGPPEGHEPLDEDFENQEVNPSSLNRATRSQSIHELRRRSGSPTRSPESRLERTSDHALKHSNGMGAALASTIALALGQDDEDGRSGGRTSRGRPKSGRSDGLSAGDHVYDPGVNRNAVAMLRRLLEHAQTSLDKQRKEFQTELAAKEKEIKKLKKSPARDKRGGLEEKGPEVLDALGLGFGAQTLLKHVRAFRTARAAVAWRRLWTIARIKEMHKERISYPTRSHDYQMLTRLMEHTSFYIESLDRARDHYTSEVARAQAIILKSIEAAAYNAALVPTMQRRLNKLGGEWDVDLSPSPGQAERRSSVASTLTITGAGKSPQPPGRREHLLFRPAARGRSQTVAADGRAPGAGVQLPEITPSQRRR